METINERNGGPLKRNSSGGGDQQHQLGRNEGKRGLSGKEAALVSDVIYAATAEQLAPSAFILATKIMV